MAGVPVGVLELPERRLAAAGRRPEWRRFLANRRAAIGAMLLALLLLVSLLAPVLAPHDPDRQVPGAVIQAPSWPHPLGTDGFGRDVLSRLLWGGRVSQLIGLLSTAVSIAVGTVVGAIAGYRGGAADSALMRVTEGVVTFPTVFLLVTLVAVFGASVPLLDPGSRVRLVAGDRAPRPGRVPGPPGPRLRARGGRAGGRVGAV